MFNWSIFLETTIQVDRIFGTKERRRCVRNNLKGKAIVSSKTVLGEFMNTFVHDAVIFYNLVVDSETTDEAIKRLPRYRERIVKRSMLILATIAEESGYDKQDLLDRLEQLIEWGLVKRFNDGIALLVGTNCKKTDSSPMKEGDIYLVPIPGLSCSKSQMPKCDVESFFRVNHEQVVKSLAALENLEERDTDQDRMIDSSRKWLRGQDSLYGQTCQTLKDLIIAIEAPATSSIYTTNLAHFKPICIALGKNMYTETQ